MAEQECSVWWLAIQWLETLLGFSSLALWVGPQQGLLGQENAVLQTRPHTDTTSPLELPGLGGLSQMPLFWHLCSLPPSRP